MARPAARKKQKNPSQKVTRRTSQKHQKIIVSNPLIAKEWDKRKTLKQNFDKMGLSSSVNDDIAVINRNPDLDYIHESAAETSLGPSKKTLRYSAVQPTNLVKQLEKSINSNSPATERTLSDGEIKSYKLLIEKYGANFIGMSKDRKLNPYQRTARELEKKINLFHALKQGK